MVERVKPVEKDKEEPVCWTRGIKFSESVKDEPPPEKKS